MPNSTKIRFHLHLPIICLILLLHFFTSNIFTYFYLKYKEKQFLQKDVSYGKLYLKGEYEPLLKHTPHNTLPQDYAFVFVKTDEEITEEAYYTKKGERVEVTYVGKKIRRISGATPSKMASFSIPLAGFILTIFAIVHQMIRTGEIFVWQQDDKQDRLEMLCNLYGLPFLFIGVFILVIKDLWLGTGV